MEDEPAPLVAVRARRTARGTYRVRGAWVAAGNGFGAEPTVLLTITRESTRRMGDDDLRARFGLTPREGEVALLLTRGLTNAEVAAALGVRPHTAERHTERVLAKFRVRTRAAVGSAVRSGG